LLPQAAIPISMALSNRIQGEQFQITQYVGAIIVLTGIVVVLEPLLSHRHSPDYMCQAINVDEYCTTCQVESTREGCLAHRFDANEEQSTVTTTVRDFATYALALGANHTDDNSDGQTICQWVASLEAVSSGGGENLLMFWSIIMVLSCIPMALSSIYKEMTLSETELDPIYLNGWIAIFQFLYSLVLAAPAGIASSPPVEPMELPENLYDGLNCYLGEGTIETGCHPDDMCSSHAFLFFNLMLFVTVFYTVLMTYILKYGSASLLFLALTIMVPLGNLAFALPFMPGSSPMHLSDIMGLIVIMTGLVLYRFAAKDNDESEKDSTPSLATANGDEEVTTAAMLQEPLIQTGDI
jgi:hypothetical protein